MTNELIMEDCREEFVLYKSYKGGGKVFLMKGLDKSKPDFNDILTIASEFARQGYVSHVVTPVHYKDKLYSKIFRMLIGTRYYRKCPDLIVDGICYEYESFVRPWTKRKMSNMLSNGLKQSNYIIVDNNKGGSDRFLRRMVISRIKIGSQIQEVWVYEKGSIRLLWPRKTGNQ